MYKNILYVTTSNCTKISIFHYLNFKCKSQLMNFIILDSYIPIITL